MLDVWVLNVGHGDSIVIRFANGQESIVGVIDSNRVGNEPPRALTVLHSINAVDLDFVALTHPHADHYSGLHDVMVAFAGRVRSFYSFPVTGTAQNYLPRLARMYARIVKESDSNPLREKAADFVRLVKHLDSLGSRIQWLELSGPSNTLIDLPGSGLKVSALLPLRRQKGAFFQAIRDGSMNVLESLAANEMSTAIRVEYAGRTFVFGGDASSSSWREHRRVSLRNGPAASGQVVKLPHHGSADDCDEEVLDYIFLGSSEDSQRVALISANGRTHPAPAVLRALVDRKIHPYCTNLSRVCGPRIRSLYTSKGASPETAKYVNSMDPEPPASKIQVCQGDIHVSISPAGAVTVTPSLANHCALRV